jgi:hypothetical protein
VNTVCKIASSGVRGRLEPDVVDVVVNVVDFVDVGVEGPTALI